MEDDAVPEAENLVLPSSLSRASDSEKENIEKEDEKKAIETKEGEGKTSGFMKNLLPIILFGGEAEKKEDDEGKDEEQRGGFITHLISNLVSPRSSKTGEVEDSKSEDLGSNGYDQNENEGRVKETEEMEVNEARKRLKTEKKGEDGIIDNIISHFPPSIPDDAVPTSEEAFILINSIVRD